MKTALCLILQLLLGLGYLFSLLEPCEAKPVCTVLHSLVVQCSRSSCSSGFWVDEPVEGGCLGGDWHEPGDEQLFACGVTRLTTAVRTDLDLAATILAPIYGQTTVSATIHHDPSGHIVSLTNPTAILAKIHSAKFPCLRSLSGPTCAKDVDFHSIACKNESDNCFNCTAASTACHGWVEVVANSSIDMLRAQYEQQHDRQYHRHFYPLLLGVLLFGLAVALVIIRTRRIWLFLRLPAALMCFALSGFFFYSYQTCPILTQLAQ